MPIFNMRFAVAFFCWASIIGPVYGHTLNLIDGRVVSANVYRLNDAVLVYEDKNGRKALPVAEIKSIEFWKSPVTPVGLAFGVAFLSSGETVNYSPFVNHIVVSLSRGYVGVSYFSPGMQFYSIGLRVPLAGGWAVYTDWTTGNNVRGSVWLGLGKDIRDYGVRVSSSLAGEGIQLSVTRVLAK